MTAQQAVTCYRALGPHTVEALTQNRICSAASRCN